MKVVIHCHFFKSDKAQSKADLFLTTNCKISYFLKTFNESILL